MRTSRILGDPARPMNFYHCMSRMLGELPFWDRAEKEHLHSLLRNQIAFSGLEMVTYSLMGNHFHLLLGVPSERESLEAMTDKAFLDRLAYIYSEEEIELVAQQLKAHREGGCEPEAKALRAPYLNRMHNLSAFMRELKQRFTTWYNRRYDREGTIWRGRFKSVFVEESPEALRTMAAYIDLNAVRAKLVSDPVDYRWSGYSEAIAGGDLARRGLSSLVRGEVGNDEGTRNWSQIQAIYRCWLYESGQTILDDHGQEIRPGLPNNRTEKLLAERGALSYATLAACRIRHFTDGTVFGSPDFMEEVCERHRKSFGHRRANGARTLGLMASAGLMTFRSLRRKAKH